MECWTELVTQPKQSPLQQAQQLAYIKYTAPQAPGEPEPRTRPTIVTSESRGLILSSGTTGFRTWEAALHLGTFLATPAGKAVVRGKRVVELGAGTGFLSLFCAKHLDVRGVVVTDREPALVGNIQDCVDRNGLDRGVIRPAIWEWGSSLDLDCSDSDQRVTFDVALGADLVVFFLSPVNNSTTRRSGIDCL